MNLHHAYQAKDQRHAELADIGRRERVAAFQMDLVPLNGSWEKCGAKKPSRSEAASTSGSGFRWYQ
jgi:hypothetical protein